jgi:molecular chaperone DnaK
LCQYNKLLGEFNLEGIAPARRGMPQIEVTFDIDANGIMHISAKDKSTGKENKITIKSNSGLSDAEIEQMVKDAELNAEADKTARTLIETRNQAEAMAHELKKDAEELKDQLTETEISDAEAAIKAVSDAGDDVDAIKAAIEKVTNVAVSFAQKKQLNESGQTADVVQDDVVDATFTEKKAD